MAAVSEVIQIAVDELHFDRQNPRLAEYGITASATDEEIMATLWDAMDVNELVLSIAASGYFPHEELIVSVESGKNIVIEGNRRLAAVRALRDPKLAKEYGWDLPRIKAEARRQLENLPAVVEERQDAWRYLGFKHVNGPAKWSSYAKARYIASVHNDYKISLEEIARQIGDGHRTVQRLFRGLMVLEQAEREKVYNREDRSRPRLAFSHLYTGLEYDGIAGFLSIRGIEDETKSPVPKRKLGALGEICVWLYGSKKQNLPPVVQTQNPHLRQLNAVLESREAIAALRDTNDLSIAFEYSRAPDAVLEDSLLRAKRELETARKFISTGFDQTEDLLRLASTVADIADDIHAEMLRLSQPKRPRRHTRK